MPTQYFREDTRKISRNKIPKINILPQMRRELPDTKKLEELGASIISTGGNINPILIVRIKGHDKAQAYADFFVKMYGTKSATDITPDSDDVYFFLLAGHCRFVSILPLSKKDVPKIKITVLHPEVEDNVAYHAVLIQMAENIHNRPPAHVEADSIAAIWNAHKISFPDSKLSFAALAREIGRSPETISNSLRWRGLNESIRIEVVSGRLAFGAGIELGRLFDAQVDGNRIISDEIIFAKMRAAQAQATPIFKLKKEIDSLILHNSDVANGSDFFLETGKSIQELLADEARSSAGAHHTMLRTQIERMTQYARVVKEHPELLKSEMGAIYEGGTRDLFILYVSHIEEVGKLLHDRDQIDDLTQKRSNRAIKGIRASIL